MVSCIYVNNVASNLYWLIGHPPPYSDSPTTTLNPMYVCVYIYIYSYTMLHLLRL